MELHAVYDKPKFVALYLRKSRGEEDTDLEKHRLILRDEAKKHGWKSVEYQEIGSSENIEFRPTFKRLLNYVKSGIYDAVAVVDYDRLGRGDLIEHGTIKRAFTQSKTLIATPQKWYDLSNEADDFQSDFEGLFAHHEYKKIVKRLRQGKRVGTLMGKWTNGTPPYPYEYNRETKGLVVNQQRAEIYDRMKRLALDGKPCYEIIWVLNNEGILSPRGKLWQENTVRRILLDETHMGRIISNKTKGGLHKNKKALPYEQVPKEEWVVIEECHEALKTEEEHNKIVALFAQRKIVPKASRKGKYTLSGLVHCGKCGYSMQFLTKPNGKVFVKNCQKADPFGNRCGNSGLDTTYIFEAITAELEHHEKALLEISNEVSNAEELRLEKKLQDTHATLKKYSTAKARVQELYEMGDIETKEEYMQRKSEWEKKILALKKDIEEIERTLNHVRKVTVQEKIAKIQNLREVWASDVDTTTKNRIAAQVIEKISYVREELSTINIEVQFR